EEDEAASRHERTAAREVRAGVRRNPQLGWREDRARRYPPFDLSRIQVVRGHLRPGRPDGAHVDAVLIHELVRGYEPHRPALREQVPGLGGQLCFLLWRDDRAGPPAASALTWQRQSNDRRQRLGHHV